MSHTAKPHHAKDKSPEGKAPVEMMSFDAASNQVMDACKRNLELALQVAGVAFEGMEKARGIQFDAVRTAQAKAVEMQQALGQIGSPADLLTSEQRLLMDNMQQAMACWGQLLEVVTQTNASISRILNGEASAATMNATEALNKALGALQPGAGGESRAAAPDWMAAITAANAASQQMWENTGKMLESFNWRMPGTKGGGAEPKG